MTPERWQRINAILHDALQREAAERTQFVSAACAADPSLRAEVEQLLRQDDLANREGFLSAPTPHILANGSAKSAEVGLAGARLGAYELREQIGAGGMGTVYRATRVDDYRQEVAIKLVRPGLESDDFLRRFRTERQVLAALNHPNIARLLDGGTTPDGAPYCVMEYIAGQPLDRYCDAHQLALRDRLALFETVCRAVHHAHEQSVIHRDLKPGNILVTAAGTPKITDFGLAKDTAGDASLTQSGAVFGTPQYMAPEQAGGKSKAATPAADVYSLGAILYELLTGRPPHRGETPLKTVLQVLHEEPIPPSRLHPGLPRDVETICLKCLQKEPRQRYADARALADDVKRFLDHEPIQARPIGRIERTWRWCWRRPLVAALLASLILVGTGGLAGVVSLWILAERRAAALQREKEETARQRDRARQAVDDMYTRVAEEWLAHEPHLQEVQREFLRKALEYYQTLAAETDADPQLRHKTAQAYYRIGLIHAKLGGERSQVLDFLRQAVAIWERLAAEFPDDARYPLALFHSSFMIAETLVAAGEDAAAARDDSTKYARRLVDRFPDEPKHWDILAHHYGVLGTMAMNQDRLTDAARHFEDGIEVARRISQRHPQQPFLRKNVATNSYKLGWLMTYTNRLEQAEPVLRHAVQVQAEIVADPGPDFSRIDRAGLQLDLARYHTTLGVLLQEIGRPKEAEELHQAAVTRLEQLARDYASIHAFGVWSAFAHEQLAHFYHATGRTEDADREFRHCLTIRERLLKDFPGQRHSNTWHLAILLATCPSRTVGDPARAAALAKELLAADPNAAGAWQVSGLAAYRSGDWRGCLQALAKARREPDRTHQTVCDLVEAMAHHRLGNAAEARAAYQKAVERMAVSSTTDLRRLRAEAEAVCGLSR